MAATYELARKYYPRLWSAERINALVVAGKLTREQADEIMGENTADEKER